MSNGTPSRKRRARDLVDLTFLSLSRRIQAEGLVDRSHVYPTRSASPQFIRPTAANIPKTSARRNQNAELNSAHGTPTTPRARRSNGNASTSKAKLVAPSLRIVQNEDSESSEEESPPPSTSKAKAKPKVKSKSNEEELSPSKKLENWNHETMSNEDKQFIERVKKLKAAGRWSSSKAISPPEEPDRAKTHWDFLLEEVKWMYLDFKNERHIHQLYTKKISTAVLKYHKDLNKNLYDENDERAKKEREKEAKKVCSTIAKMVREFWQKAETVVDFGQKEMDEAKKREALDKHLNLLVDEADLLSKSINVESDFENEADENDAGAGLNKLAELKALKSDANIHLDDILSHLPEGYLESYHTSKRLNGTEKIVEEPMTNGVKSKEESAEPMEISREARKLEVNGEEEVVEKDSSATQTPDIPMEVDEKAKKDRSDALDQIAAEAEQFQPKGNTLATAEVTIQHPVLIDGHLREYQLVGLQWLFSLYEKNLNGILADEMGLGKTIQTIALFAHLAAEHSVWGPHLIVVPTSVILNWEMEFKKWCPSVKVLTYFGSAKERAEKRKGWMANKSFDVCITSYKLYTQDVRCFKRKQWQYLVLDEAQHIKNFESQRWQSLINLRTRRRLLLTGTPLQNNLLELWSLLHFLMPRVFTSRDDFKDWFNNPIAGMIEGSVDYNSKIVQRLHKVLRPFILRRLKSEVEKQLPPKVEKVVKCPLSKRQRYLYNEFMSLRTTKESLSSGSMVSVLNIVMQLRKCCNHPNLFEPREVETPLCPEIERIRFPRMVVLEQNGIDLRQKLVANGSRILQGLKIEKEKASPQFASILRPTRPPAKLNMERFKERLKLTGYAKFLVETPYPKEIKQHITPIKQQTPVLNQDLIDFLSIFKENTDQDGPIKNVLRALRISKEEWIQAAASKFNMYVMEVLCRPLHPDDRFYGKLRTYFERFQVNSSYNSITDLYSKRTKLDDDMLINRLMRFPEARLIEYDCGKLQTLARLLRNLYEDGHRCLIFTQMSKMLDILQAFLAHHGYVYFRLDGATPVEKRQALMERFNSDPKVFCFILSTRAGGVGINLIGADTVIFYDSDWNPTMDAQAQDRCHRIGQTKSVTIYRLISSNTIEENILKKAREKRRLGEITIDEGGFTPQFFKKADNIRDLFFDEDTNPEAASVPIAPIMAVASEEDLKLAMERAEDRQDVIAAKRAEAEIVAEEIEFDDKSNFNYTDQSNDEFMQIVRMLRPIEQYAVQFLSKEYRPENYKVPLPNGEVQSAENSNPMILESQPRKKKVNFVKKPVGPSTIQTRNRKTRATR
ncbi:unnamed protein product [Bursaphelenchus xylophilus]|uniref:(pine wood nematode) hypothetical protein n=1 Tax=Bursaphelenchus xylophilus TaxID=6326 RepID=A0A7I8XEU3_BURXY|nr:unnamed protein product [Bursaphelenchus xylophilus]CAG9112982.1 unnamed protein product [Bursaphelenchus xylophilus]